MPVYSSLKNYTLKLAYTYKAIYSFLSCMEFSKVIRMLAEKHSTWPSTHLPQDLSISFYIASVPCYKSQNCRPLPIVAFNQESKHTLARLTRGISINHSWPGDSQAESWLHMVQESQWSQSLDWSVCLGESRARPLHTSLAAIVWSLRIPCCGEVWLNIRSLILPPKPEPISSRH